MKHLFSLLFIGGFLFSGCERMERDFINDPDVKSFIKSIKNGTYNLRDENGELLMPSFYDKHIPELLEYADDMTIIDEYPISLLSSAMGDKRLSVCVLWTIEGIRIGSKHASLNRTLIAKINDEEGREVTNDEVLKIAKLYNDWWNGAYPFNKRHDKYEIDPLENTEYNWN